MPIIQGPYQTWKIGPHVRRHATVTMPFEEAALLFEPALFNASTNKGEQRKPSEAHVRNLKKEILEGRFTPTCWACTLPTRAQKEFVYDEATSTFRLTVKDGRTLPNTNGGHRRLALLRILDDYAEQRKLAHTEERRAYYDGLIQDVERLPITVELQLDGDSRLDFLNLQKGKAVARSLMFSMEVKTKQFDDPNYVRSYDIANLLNSERASPFFLVVQCDDHWNGGSPLPISTLCSGTSSDIATSLVGLARVGQLFGFENKNLCRIVCAAVSAIESRKPDILHAGFPLTPPKYGGKRGSCTMLVGIAVQLTYAMGLAGKTVPDPDLLTRFVDSAAYVMGEKIERDLGGPRKRFLMGEFAREFFRESDVEKHEGVPLGLCRTLSPGSLGCSRLSKSEMKESVVAANV